MSNSPPFPRGLRAVLRRLARDQRGGLVAAEYLLIGTLLTIGLITGIAAVRTAVIERLDAMAALINPDSEEE